MNKVVSLKRISAEQLFRERLRVAISILARHAEDPMSEDLLVAVEDLSEDLVRMCDSYRREQL